jgi:hypothetical protein
MALLLVFHLCMYIVFLPTAIDIKTIEICLTKILLTSIATPTYLHAVSVPRFDVDNKISDN